MEEEGGDDDEVDSQEDVEENNDYKTGSGNDRTTRIRLRKKKFARLRYLCSQFGDMPMKDYVDAVIYDYQN